MLFGPLIRAIGPKKTIFVDLAIWLLLFVVVLAIRLHATLQFGGIHLDGKQLFMFAALALYVLVGASLIFLVPDVRPSRENFAARS